MLAGWDIFAFRISQDGKRRKPVWLWLKLLIFLLNSGAGSVARYATLFKIINVADFFVFLLLLDLDAASVRRQNFTSYLYFNFASLQPFLAARKRNAKNMPTKFYIPGVSLRNSTQDKCGRWMIETTGHRQITTRCSRDQAFWLSVIKASIPIAGICEKRSHKYPREINWTLRSIKQKPRLTDLTLAREESQPRNNKFLRVSYAIIYNIVHDKYQNNRNKLLIYSLFPRACRTLFSGVRSLQLLDQFWCFPRFNNVSSFDMQRSAMTTTSFLFQ